MVSMFPEYDIYIAPDGTELTFDRLSDRFLQSFEGYGMSPIKYVEQQGALQDGVTIYDYKLQKRIIQWTIRQNGCSRWDYWEKRALFLDVLRPNKHTFNNFGPGKLRKMLPTGFQRDIDVFVEFGPIFSSPSGGWDEWGFTEAIRFVAPDPTFYDPVSGSLAVSAAIANTELEFPITFPIEFGSSVFSATNNITYGGTWLTYPTITIVGPATAVLITNTATGERIIFNGAIRASQTVTILLQYGNKSVTNNSGDNLIGSITPDSDLATFHLAPAPEATGGVNPIYIVATGTSGATLITLSYFTRYIGI
jgi:hypothetical protein